MCSWSNTQIKQGMVVFIAPSISFFVQISKCHWQVTLWLTGCFFAISLLSQHLPKYLEDRAWNCQTPPYHSKCTLHVTMLYLVCSVTLGPVLQKSEPGCTVCSPGFHHLRSFIWNSKTHGSRGVTRLLLTACYQAALMSSRLLTQILEVLCCSRGQQQQPFTSSHPCQTGTCE